MVGSRRKKDTRPAYDRDEIDDQQIVREQEEDAARGHDQRAALWSLLRKAVRTGTPAADAREGGRAK